METFQLLHLARVWSSGSSAAATTTAEPLTVHPHHHPASVDSTDSAISGVPAAYVHPTPDENTRIRAAAVHMIFASRLSQEMIKPEAVVALEEWSGRAVLEAVAGFTLNVSFSRSALCKG